MRVGNNGSFQNKLVSGPLNNRRHWDASNVVTEHKILIARENTEMINRQKLFATILQPEYS